MSLAVHSPFGALQPQLTYGFASPSNSPRKRRKRSETPDDGSTQGQGSDDVDMTALNSALPAKRVKSESFSKRFKNPSIVANTAQPSPVASTSSTAEEYDLGKSLSTLSKPALISILTTLSTQQPALKATIASLIPPPSLEAYSDLLQTLEKKVLDAIPLGAGLRPEYVYGRIRTVLEDYVQENRHYLSLFTYSNNSTETSSSNWTEINHPSTVFTFLCTLTASIRRLEAALPQPVNDPFAAADNNTPYRLITADPLNTSLVPQLFNAWHILVTKASHAINQQGRIWSAETLRSRLRQLDELATLNVQVGDSITRREIENVRDRLMKEIGWLISGTSSAFQSSMEASYSRRRARSMSLEDD